MDSCLVFKVADKQIESQPIDKIDLAALGADRFAWLDLESTHPNRLRSLLSQLQVPESELDELLCPDNAFWSQHHQKYVLSKIAICRLEGDRYIHVPLIIVLTSSFILTAHGESPAPMDKVHASYQESFRTIGKSPVFVYFLLWDAIVDGFLPKIFYIDNLLEEIEEQYMEGKAGSDILDRIAMCKNMERAIKRSLLPMQRVMRHMGSTKLGVVSDEARSYLQQLFEHLDRLSQTIDSLQDRVHSALAGYNWVLAQQQNNVLKVLTIIATIMMPLSLIAGIYGMNFDFMPELHSKFGHFIVLSIMAILGGTMLAIFKRRKWL